MKTIMLVCSGGMSTSLLVSKMQKAAEAKNIETDIFAISASEVDSILEKKNIDILLLGPQVRYMKPPFEKKLQGKNIPIEVINMKYYGKMNGENVLEEALKLIDNN